MTDHLDAILQFGTKKPGLVYTPRPTVNAVILDQQGRVACVDTGRGYFLLGGGIDDGESDVEALAREVAEEVGRTVTIGEVIGKANEYVYAAQEGVSVNKNIVFYRAELGAGSPDVSCEYTLEWLPVSEFAAKANHQSHVWAVQTAVKTSHLE